MCLVGETFDESSDEVCGAVVHIREKVNKLAIWTKDNKKDEDTIKIG